LGACYLMNILKNRLRKIRTIQQPNYHL
jgi:hypothetical protein